MKHGYEIKTPEFIRLEKSFRHWLQALNFNKKTISGNPVRIREFFHWLEKGRVTTIGSITAPVTTNYFLYLSERQNIRKGGRLSKNTLQAYGQSLRRFTRYLRETGQESFEVSTQLTRGTKSIKTIFSKAEIAALYNASGSDLFGLRDKAMLSIYYGCGLRRNEGVSLDTSDILFEKNLLYVRTGKNYKERYVPMPEGVKEYLRDYMNYARPTLLKEPCTGLFLNQYGRRISGESIAERLQQLKEKAGIDKKAGLHALRHSIATHLLQSGMELEQIKLFLGHSSLESTQIYTHITYEATE